MRQITYVDSRGASFKLWTTVKRLNDKVMLTTDPSNHPAWQGGGGKIENVGQIAKFNQRYKGLMHIEDDNQTSDDK